MARNVVFKVDADTGKAIQGFLQLANAQQKNERQFEKSTGKMSAWEKQMNSIGGSIKSSLGAFALGAVGFSSISAGIQSYLNDMDQVSRKNRQFQTDITAYLALGDNIRNSKSLSRGLLDMSEATGLDPRAIADLKFALQSSAGSLSKEIQQSIESNTLDLSKLTGSEPQANLRLLVKGMIQFGDEVKDATELANKFNLAAEMGDTNFGILARQFPEVGGAVKAVGGSLDEALGALVALTQTEGDSTKAMTSFRNIILSLEDAISKGLIPQAGTLTEKLKSMDSLSFEQLLKIFGKENISAAQNLASAMGVMGEATDKINNVDTSRIKELINLRLDDPAYRAADAAAKAEQIVNNSDLRRPDVAEKSMEDSLYKIERQIVRENMQPWLKDVPGAEMGSWLWAKGMDKLGVGGGEGLGDTAAMRLKEAQMAEGTSPEDIAFYRAKQRNDEARKKAGLDPMGSDGVGAGGSSPGGRPGPKDAFEFFGIDREMSAGPVQSPRLSAQEKYDRMMSRLKMEDPAEWTRIAGRGQIGYGRAAMDQRGNSGGGYQAGTIINVNQLNVHGSAEEYRQIAMMSAHTPRTG